jgi:hypothetical protein
MDRDPHPTLPRKPRKPEPPVGTPAHDDWMIDEASYESFPASDPPAQQQPQPKK